MAATDSSVFSLPGRPGGQAQLQPISSQRQAPPPPPPPGQQVVPPTLSPDFDGPFRPLTRASTVPASLLSSSSAAMSAKAPATTSTATATVRRADPYHLAPEDAFYTSVSPPWDRNAARNHNNATANNNANNVSGSELHEPRSGARQSLRPGGSGGVSSTNLRRSASGALMGGGGGGGGGGADSRSRSRRRRRRTWKKLLWVKQSYPDNYTDQATFLENLQRNPRLQPYDFWPLVADSTVIVQHVCSVIIFIICFVGISQDRVSPVSVVGWGSIATCLGWVLWEWWAGQEQQGRNGSEDGYDDMEDVQGSQRVSRRYREPSNGGSASADQSPPSAAYSIPSNQASRQSKYAVPSAAATTTTTTTMTDTLLPELLPSANSSTTSLLNMSNRHGRNSGLVHVHSRSSSKGNTYSNPNGGTGIGTGINTGRNTSASTSTNTSSLWHSSGIHSSLSQVSTGSTASSTAAAYRPPSSHGRSPIDQIPATPATPRYPPPRRSVTPQRGGRTHHRIATVKSAVLIYFTLLGLSPILKSLTRSTSSDSIWAMSFWLLTINIFFFDYSGVWVGAHKFPVASLSTNAALMASTVLASRLPSTGQVFSLTLFSIEVFGLFPVFRRYARHRSWQYHVGLTVLLVLGAGAGVGIILTEPGEGLPWWGAAAGMVVACLLSAIAMGGCSWWLIGLQKYKNEIYGPWDPARPVIMSRRHWNDV